MLLPVIRVMGLVNLLVGIANGVGVLDWSILLDVHGTVRVGLFKDFRWASDSESALSNLQ